jgi:hypothetical protein
MTMPTAEILAPQTDIVKIEIWTNEIDHPPSWGELHSESFCDQQLQTEIDRAKSIVELEQDWDGEGSPGYSQHTLDRATAFLSAHMERLWNTYGIRAPIPSIGPGPDGSIDIHWKQRSWELLVNIPADANEMAAFYGDNYGTQKIKGSLDPETFNLGIAEWLAN